ncbi:MAG: hypothetical protein L7F78_25690, partial [Syntrophales bacterium LBB04]|nr:hypothetical protein [Syntrophales bacterium LBB04]
PSQLKNRGLSDNVKCFMKSGKWTQKIIIHLQDRRDACPADGGKIIYNIDANHKRKKRIRITPENY